MNFISQCLTSLSIRNVGITILRRQLSYNRCSSLSRITSLKLQDVLLPKVYSRTHGSNLSCHLTQQVRRSTVFTSLPAVQLWEGVTGPKGSTKKRARGKRRVTRPKIDLHRGQRLGMGKASMEWPGLNVPLIDDRSIRVIKPGEMNTEYFQRLEELRNKSAVKKKRIKIPPLLRGWSGSRLGGQSIGPPSPEYSDFDTRVLEMKVVATMTATAGRYRRFSVLVATGNGLGLCGIGKAKAISLSAAVKRAKQRAAQNLVSYELCDGRTLWHIGHAREWHTTIFAKPGVEGSGLVCHRVLRTLSQIIGIKDIYAKVEGSTKNYQVLVRGFLRLLSEQQTYSQLADVLGLHVVQFSQDHDLYPRVLASPIPGTIPIVDRNATLLDVKQRAVSVQSKDEELPILAISHPERHRPRRPPVEKNESFLDDLVDVDEEPSVAAEAVQLIASGERELDAVVLGGRVPLIRGKPKPFYWNNPGNVKVAKIRYRFRNHEAAKRERDAYDALDQLTL